MSQKRQLVTDMLQTLLTQFEHATRYARVVFSSGFVQLIVTKTAALIPVETALETVSSCTKICLTYVLALSLEASINPI